MTSVPNTKITSLLTINKKNVKCLNLISHLIRIKKKQRGRHISRIFHKQRLANILCIILFFFSKNVLNDWFKYHVNSIESFFFFFLISGQQLSLCKQTEFTNPSKLPDFTDLDLYFSFLILLIYSNILYKN